MLAKTKELSAQKKAIGKHTGVRCRRAEGKAPKGKGTLLPDNSSFDNLEYEPNESCTGIMNTNSSFADDGAGPSNSSLLSYSGNADCSLTFNSSEDQTFDERANIAPNVDVNNDNDFYAFLPSHDVPSIPYSSLYSQLPSTPSQFDPMGFNDQQYTHSGQQQLTLDSTSVAEYGTEQLIAMSADEEDRFLANAGVLYEAELSSSASFFEFERAAQHDLRLHNVNFW